MSPDPTQSEIVRRTVPRAYGIRDRVLRQATAHRAATPVIPDRNWLPLPHRHLRFRWYWEPQQAPPSFLSSESDSPVLRQVATTLLRFASSHPETTSLTMRMRIRCFRLGYTLAPTSPLAIQVQGLALGRRDVYLDASDEAMVRESLQCAEKLCPLAQERSSQYRTLLELISSVLMELVTQPETLVPEHYRKCMELVYFSEQASWEGYDPPQSVVQEAECNLIALSRAGR